MTDNLATELVEKYRDALQNYLVKSGETALQEAYELGRQALISGLGVMAVASAYHTALATVLSGASSSEENARLIQMASIFFTESLSSFEMAQRGYQETIVQLRELNKALEQQREQLRGLSAHLESVREQERTRLAREIHDELGQTLTAMKMDLVWCKHNFHENQDILEQKIQSMANLIDTTSQAVHLISTELRPGILDDLGLIDAIKWQLQEFQVRTGITCQLTSLIKGHLSITPEHSTAAFRIFQETLTNVARHANANAVEVILKKRHENLIMEVHDNGRGITDSEIADSKSFGIMGMRERVLLCHGDMQIYGQPGKGTTITMQMPLDKPHSLPVHLRKAPVLRKEVK